jgi:AcrR family transcriptional regulator
MAGKTETRLRQGADNQDRPVVLRKVMEVLSAKGFSKASIADLTSATGLDIGALRKTFGTRDEILRAAIRFCAETEACLAQEPLRVSRTGREAILAMFEENVRLASALQHYRLAGPSDSATLIGAVRSSLQCLSVAPASVSFPLLADVYRAALGKVDFSMFLTGRTGVFKTALAALCQQHFGAGLDASHLPASFACTSQAVQCLASQAKNALLVLDDFVPTGRHSDSALQNAAEQLFRSAGNHQGRSRMNGRGRPSAAQPPQALLLATGEQVPQGQSIRARMLIVEVKAGDVSRTVLSECQSAAAEGFLALSISGFVKRIARRYEELQQRLHNRVREIRSHGRGREIHGFQGH